MGQSWAMSSRAYARDLCGRGARGSFFVPPLPQVPPYGRDDMRGVPSC
jgi:hypothetical protein